MTIAERLKRLRVQMNKDYGIQFSERGYDERLCELEREIVALEGSEDDATASSPADGRRQNL